MTILITLLSIYALTTTAMTITYYRAWRDTLQAFEYVIEGEHDWLDDLPHGDHPPHLNKFTRPQTYDARVTTNPVQKYGEELRAG